MNWFYFSLISIIALALAELTQQHILNAKNNIEERTSACLTFLIQSFFTIPFIFVFKVGGEFLRIFQADLFPYFIITSIIGSVGMIFYLRSFKVKNISISTIFVSFSVVVTTTIGILFFNETTYLYKFIGIALVLIAIISVNIKNLNIEKNHFWGILAGLMFGVTYSLDKMIVTYVHPLIYIFWTFMLVAFFGFIFGPRIIYKAVRSSKLADFKPIVISGIGYFIYNMCTFFAYRFGGEVGRVDAINNSQIFLIILTEYFLFKHRDGLLRKFVTAGVAFGGVLILGYL